MFGHRFYGARYFAPRYWGDGGLLAPEPPEPPPSTVTIPAGAAMRRAARRIEPAIETAHATVTVSGGGSVFIQGHKAVEYPPDDEVLQFLGMI